MEAHLTWLLVGLYLLVAATTCISITYANTANGVETTRQASAWSLAWPLFWVLFLMMWVGTLGERMYLHRATSRRNLGMED